MCQFNPIQFKEIRRLESVFNELCYLLYYEADRCSPAERWLLVSLIEKEHRCYVQYCRKGVVGV